MMEFITILGIISLSAAFIYARLPGIAGILLSVIIITAAIFLIAIALA
jgi:hypothetical protein